MDAYWSIIPNMYNLAWTEIKSKLLNFFFKNWYYGMIIIISIIKNDYRMIIKMIIELFLSLKIIMEW